MDLFKTMMIEETNQKKNNEFMKLVRYHSFQCLSKCSDFSKAAEFKLSETEDNCIKECTQKILDSRNQIENHMSDFFTPEWFSKING